MHKTSTWTKWCKMLLVTRVPLPAHSWAHDIPICHSASSSDGETGASGVDEHVTRWMNSEEENTPCWFYPGSFRWREARQLRDKSSKGFSSEVHQVVGKRGWIVRRGTTLRMMRDHSIRDEDRIKDFETVYACVRPCMVWMYFCVKK